MLGNSWRCGPYADGQGCCVVLEKTMVWAVDAYLPRPKRSFSMRRAGVHEPPFGRHQSIYERMASPEFSINVLVSVCKSPGCIGLLGVTSRKPSKM